MKETDINISELPQETMYVYCRVSTGGQEKDGSSLEIQKNRGIEQSKILGLKPIIIQEQGSGLKSFDESRPLFTFLFDNIQSGNIQNFWVDDETRLTRNDIDQQVVHLQMKQIGVKYYVGTNKEPKEWSFQVDLIDTIITKVNQDQIQRQVRKSIRSKRKLFEDGCYMKGDPPFGYKLVDKRLVIDPENSEWIKNIFDWYNSGKSTVWIRQQLFLNQVTPPRQKNDWFTLGTINNILHNKNFIGIDVYRDLTNECPKIVSKDLFYSVQKKLKKKSGRSIETKHDFLLRGIIKCPDRSDMSILGKKKSRRNPLYSCGHRVRKSQKRPTQPCPIKRSIRSESFDQYIWDVLMSTLSQSHQIKELTKRQLLGKNTKLSTKGIKQKIQKLNKEVKELDDNRLELEKKYYTNEIPNKKFNILNDYIDIKERELTDELTGLKIRLENQNNQSNWIDWLDEHYKSINDLRIITDFNSKRQIIQQYIDEILVLDYDDDTQQHIISIKFKIPLFDDSFLWLKNKNGTFKLDRYGRRQYRIDKGNKELITPFTLQSLLHSN
jgi:site-specific DNA recombinase